MATAGQIKTIYALANQLSLSNRNGDDLLHQLIRTYFEIDSVKALSSKDADRLIRMLRDLCGHSAMMSENQSDRMSDGQKKKVWYLMYQLQGLDKEPNPAKLGERLCGIIRRQLHVDALPKDPFCWLDYQDGNRLIEFMKQYIRTARERSGAHG